MSDRRCRPFEDIISWYQSSHPSVTGNVLVCIDTVAREQPFLKIIHRVFASSATHFVSQLSLTPGFVELADVDVEDLAEESSVDRTQLKLSWEAKNSEISARF